MIEKCSAQRLLKFKAYQFQLFLYTPLHLSQKIEKIERRKDYIEEAT